MAPRPTWKQVKDTSKFLVEGVAIVQTVWDAISSDDRLPKAVAEMLTRLRETRGTADPVTRLTEQLDVIDASCAELAASEDAQNDPEDAEKVRTWQRQATVLRSKIPLVQAQVGAERRQSMRDLRSRTATLLAAVIRHGLEGDDDEPLPMTPQRSPRAVRRAFPWVDKED